MSERRSKWRRSAARDDGLQLEELERLRRAEVALATAESTEAAARELADHTMALLGARAAVVLIEGQSDTIRVTGGDPDAVYEDGSRMRLLEIDGTPVGSIAVGPRAGGAPYDSRDERILDALGQGISSALQRLVLFDQVRNERRTLADVLTSSSDGIFSAGPDHRVRAWNPGVERVTGIPAKDALGEQCCAVFKPFDADGTPLFGAACPGRAATQLDARLVRIERTTGEERWLECAWSPMQDGGHVVVARDITAQKRVEDQKADFLANISHELRTPLTPIQGFLDTLLRQEERFGPEERKRVYQLMLQQAGRLERLVKDLLLATSLDEPEAAPVTEPVEWPELVADLVDRFRRQDPSREIALVVAPELPAVLADREHAAQVLGNVLDNAMKYTPAGSPVRIKVERDGPNVVTTVEDEGKGIPPEDRELIFERFTRLGDHLTREQGGAGLGLYVARRLVDSMGGEIAVDESPAGAVFRVTLPVADANGGSGRQRRTEPLRAIQ